MNRFAPSPWRLNLWALPRLLLLAVFTLQLAPAQQPSSHKPQQEPSREPVLRIETGRHTAAIRRIGVDAANRYLVTASDDKTVRVWELPSGRLLRVLRPPLGTGNEGKLYSVAISPDGSTIATGGWTSPIGTDEDIYLFNRESGRLLQRLGGLPNVVNHLAYSPDGQYLVATLAGKNGIRIYQTSDYNRIGEDKDYSDDSYGADFDRSGRLATTSDDGFIRLYAPPSEGRLRLLAKRSTAAGKQPFGISFSPDGSRLAVGFQDSTNVVVLSARDLSPLYSPDTADVDNGYFCSVAWSYDGQTLYAGGDYHRAVGRTIRYWGDGGRGRWRDVAASHGLIPQILPLRHGGAIYGTDEPGFGVLDANGKRTLFIGSQIADYSGPLQLLISPEGAKVQFAYDQAGKSSARFSVNERQLGSVSDSVSNNALSPPRVTGLNITDWKDTPEPKLNGTRLRLQQDDLSRSLAITPDAGAFLLGTEFWLHLFDRNGVMRWKAPIPGVSWLVNISADGQLAVAAFGDGTIRWYRMKDGKELLAFFPHADRKRWVVWTPSGYYDASPGAEDLLIWHVNNGRDRAADFFPVGQFRETFYRPDVVAKVLKTLDERLALKEANDERGLRQQRAEVEDLLPPVVEIISPSDGAQITPGEISVRYRLRTPTAEPVTSIMAMVDGKTVAVEHSLNLKAGGDGVERQIKVKIPAGATLLSVLAMNRFAPSVAATARLTPPMQVRDPEVDPNFDPPAAAPKPALYVLAIGVGKYASKNIPGLKYPAKDVEAFTALMKAQEGRRYSKVTIKPLADANASRLEISKGLDWIRKETGEADVAMIFFAGHGMTEDNLYYFLPTDADTESLTGTGVSFDMIVNTFLRIRGQKILFIDTCRSGAVLGKRGVIDINGIANTLNKAEYGVAVFTASTGNESAVERDDWGNGAFTKALVEGLSGRAAQGTTREIYFSMLDTYLTRRVRELTNQLQTPTATRPLTVPDFTLAHAR